MDDQLSGSCCTMGFVGNSTVDFGIEAICRWRSICRKQCRFRRISEKSRISNGARGMQEVTVECLVRVKTYLGEAAVSTCCMEAEAACISLISCVSCDAF